MRANPRLGAKGDDHDKHPGIPGRRHHSPIYAPFQCRRFDRNRTRADFSELAAGDLRALADANSQRAVFRASTISGSVNRLSLTTTSAEVWMQLGGRCTGRYGEALLLRR